MLTSIIKINNKGEKMREKPLKKKTFADRISAAIAQLIILVIVFIPTFLYLIARFILSPEGFVQEVLVFGIGLWFLGSIQILLLILGAIATWGFWTDVY